jgi:hypothetical protein
MLGDLAERPSDDEPEGGDDVIAGLSFEEPMHGS